MITVFNQFKSPWILKFNAKRNASVFSKKRKVDPTDENSKKVYIQVEVEEGILDSSLTNRLEGMVQTREPMLLTDMDVAVGFDNKTLIPILQKVKSKKGVSKNILLLSLNLRDSQVVDINGADTFLLEGCELPGYFSAIISFNKPESQFSVTMYDNKTQNLITHIFSVANNNIVYDKEFSKNTSFESGYDSFMIKKFRPSRVTEGILVLESDIQRLSTLEFYAESGETHNLFEFNEQALQTIKSEGYSAISLYVPSMTSEPQVYNNLIQTLKRDFRVFYTFNDTGKVSKIKVR